MTGRSTLSASGDIGFVMTQTEYFFNQLRATFRPSTINLEKITQRVGAGAAAGIAVYASTTTTMSRTATAFVTLFTNYQLSSLTVSVLAGSAAYLLWDDYLQPFYTWVTTVPEKAQKLAEEAAARAAAAIREAAAAVAGAMGSVGAGLQSTIQQYLYYLLAALGVYVGYKVLTA